tara:strand:- start:1260 stop:1592 length:333 start_codon:yes stop_codon:yes gene_type:complete
MVTREIEISSLQPGDYCNRDSMQFLDDLSVTEMYELGKFQVIQTEIGDVLFDGNNRTKTFSDRGMTTITADYVALDEVPIYLSGYVESVLNTVREMRERGIRTIQDMVYE